MSSARHNSANLSNDLNASSIFPTNDKSSEKREREREKNELYAGKIMGETRGRLGLSGSLKSQPLQTQGGPHEPSSKEVTLYPAAGRARLAPPIATNALPDCNATDTAPNAHDSYSPAAIFPALLASAASAE